MLISNQDVHVICTIPTVYVGLSVLIEFPIPVTLLSMVQLKPMIKAQISGRMISSGISDVAITSVYSEKTRLMKVIVIIIIMNLSQETTVFGRGQKLTSAMKLRPEK